MCWKEMIVLGPGGNVFLCADLVHPSIVWLWITTSCEANCKHLLCERWAWKRRLLAWKGGRSMSFCEALPSLWVRGSGVVLVLEAVGLLKVSELLLLLWWAPSARRGEYAPDSWGSGTVRDWGWTLEKEEVAHVGTCLWDGASSPWLDLWLPFVFCPLWRAKNRR